MSRGNQAAMDPSCIVNGKTGEGEKGGVAMKCSYEPFSSHNLTGVTTSIPSLFCEVSTLFVAILLDGAVGRGGGGGGENELHGKGKKLY